ncbi:MAG: MBL fold metallo-hydrolase [Bacteroidota bacterium]
MAKIEFLTVNPFQENTYVIFDETLECAIIDPGVSNSYEQSMLEQIIDKHQLKPVLLLNTHCHIDHVLGNSYVAKKWNLQLGIHQKDKIMLDAATDRSMNWGIPYDQSPEPGYFITEGETLKFGNTELEVRFVPGHAPGHIVFIDHSSKTVIAGDTLFNGSIGRTDLPFGDFSILEKAIREQLYTLPDDYTVYPGHGPSTTIGQEKTTNPFVKSKN